MRILHRPSWFFAACMAACLLLTGCYIPQTRARAHPAALRPLDPADRQAALGGRLRPGFRTEAVLVAWGKPSRVETVHARGQTFEIWWYVHTFNGVTGGYYGVSRGFTYQGSYYGSTDNFYLAPTQDRGLPPPQTDVPYRKAVFVQGRLIDSEPN